MTGNLIAFRRDRFRNKTMRPIAALFVVTALAAPQLGHAEVRELSPAQLRAAISDDLAIASFRLIKGVEDFTGGSVVDVRAFDVDGTVTYRILVQEDDGALGAIMLDGTSGRVIMPSTQVGREVSAFARESSQPSAASETQPAHGQGNQNANNNGGGNNGNGGNSNNGRGNGGGNGNGNDGNGNGNGGGNNGNGGGNNGNGGGNSRNR